MAKITDTTTLDGIWIGSKWNEQRAILNVPAGGSEEAGLLFLESIDGSGVLQGGLYLWADSASALRVSSSRPTDENSDGSILGTTAVSSARRALDNLATTTIINSSLVSDTDSTDDLGSSSIYWKNTFTDVLYMSATSYLTGGSSVSVLTGGLTLGADGTDTDLICYGETAGQYLHWDGDYDTTAGALILKDNVVLVLGTGNDATIEWNETDLAIDFVADNMKVQFGSVHPSDLILHGNTAGSDITWDASVDDLIVSDDVHVAFGDGSDLYLNFNAADLELRQASPTNGGLKIGVSDHGIDVTFFGDTATYDMIWNASDNALIFNDDAELTFGTALDIYMRWENSGSTLDIGQTSDGTGSIDIIDTPVLMTGADSAGTLLTIAGIDTTGNTDTVTLAHSGTGAGLHITCTEADSQGLEIDAAANQTTWAAIINGAGTPAWIGANDIGMLTLKTDTAGANAGATALLVQHATAQPITAAEGHLARFISTGTAQTNAYGVEIGVSTTQGALHVSAGHSLFAEKTTHKGVFHTVTNGKATVGGATTGLIAAGCSFWSGDSDNDAHIVVLPTAVEGQQLVVFNDDSSQDFELTAAASDTINGGTAAGAVTIAEDEVVFLFAVNATDWRAFKIAGAGTLATAGQSA